MKRYATFVGFAATVVVSCALHAQEPQPTRIAFVNANLSDVIRSLAAAMGVNVVLTDVPDKRITLRPSDLVPVSQMGPLLEAVLESEDLELVRTGPIAEVMPEAKRPATGPISVGKELPNPPPLGLITQIVPLEYMGAAEAVAFLREVASKTTHIEVVQRSNAVLITDRGVNVSRYLDLLRPLDVKSGGEAGLRTYVCVLKHANAADLANTLSQVFGNGGGAGGATERPRGQTVEHASLSSQLQSFSDRETQSFQQRETAPPPQVITLAPPTSTGPGDTSGSRAGRTGLVGQTTIVPDQATNSLVIRTAPPNFPVLQETIDQLDTRPPEVLLEVLIVEIDLDRSTQYGVNWQLFTQKLVSGTGSQGITLGSGPQAYGDSVLSGLQGLGAQVISSSSTLGISAIVQALASNTKMHVLSAPRILALNNQTARILVGSEVPFTSSSQTGLNVVVAEDVQFEDVGTQLTILPTVSRDGYVTFHILQEVSSLSSQTVASALNAPIITTREAETSVIVKNGSTIIIGGLIASSKQLIQTGVPILDDIPLLGGLFRSRSTDHSRTELAIFVTPHVVLNDDQADSVSQNQLQKFEFAKPDVDSVLAAPRPSSAAPSNPAVAKPQ